MTTISPSFDRDVRFIGQDGRTHDTAALVLVANNRYVIDPRPQHGTSGDVDGMPWRRLMDMRCGSPGA